MAIRRALRRPLQVAQVLAAVLLGGAAASFVAWVLIVGANIASALAGDGEGRLAGLWALHAPAGWVGMALGGLLAVRHLLRRSAAEAAPARSGGLLVASGAAIVAWGFAALTLADARHLGLDFEATQGLALAAAGVAGLGAWAAFTGDAPAPD